MGEEKSGGGGYYLLTLRPLSGDYHANLYKLYDSTLTIFSEIRRTINATVITYVFADRPYYHLHAVIHVKSRIDYRQIWKIVPKGFTVNFRFLPRFSDVENAKRYVNKHVPANCIGGGETVRVINPEDKKNVEVLRMSEFEERLSRLEKTVEKLVNAVEKIAEMAEKRTTVSMDSAEIELRTMRVVAQKSRKGVALRIRFARFIKPNKRGEFYIAMTTDELKNLVNGLQSFLNHVTENGQENGSSERKTKVKVENGFNP